MDHLIERLRCIDLTRFKRDPNGEIKLKQKEPRLSIRSFSNASRVLSNTDENYQSDDDTEQVI